MIPRNIVNPRSGCSRVSLEIKLRDETTTPVTNETAIAVCAFIKSNVEVTGDPLEAACGAGMFVI